MQTYWTRIKNNVNGLCRPVWNQFKRQNMYTLYMLTYYNNAHSHSNSMEQSFLSLSLTTLQATRCSLTHFPDVLFFSLCTHTVADLQLLEPGACAEIHRFTPSRWGIALNHVSIQCEPLLFNMFCFVSLSCINLHGKGWLKSHKIKTKHHWFPLLSLITVVLIGMLRSCFCRHTHTDQLTTVQNTPLTSGSIFYDYFPLFHLILCVCDGLILKDTFNIITCCMSQQN